MTAPDLKTDKTSDAVSNGGTTELDGKTDQTSRIAEGDDAGILTAAAHKKMVTKLMMMHFHLVLYVTFSKVTSKIVYLVGVYANIILLSC